VLAKVMNCSNDLAKTTYHHHHHFHEELAVFPVP
jgi:hypothetical protein